jgi:methionyl-tRNA formyltransferase
VWTLNVVFFGTPDFAIPALERLLESRHKVLAVVTQPDKPTGRGRKLQAPPVKKLAEASGLPVLQPESARDGAFHDQLRALAPDVAVVVAYGKILPRALLDIPRHGCINIHASLLPKYRGAAPIQWSVINGEKSTGVTIMQIEEGLDSGPIIEKAEVEILEDDNAVSVGHLLSLTGAALMVEVLNRLEDEGRLDMEVQDHAAATRAPMIKREMARIDWSREPEPIIWAIRGFQPWPKAHTTHKGAMLKVTGVEAIDPAWVPVAAFGDGVAPGTVVDVLKGRGVAVRTGGERGVVLLTFVQPEGKPEMTGIDAANGGYLKIGDVLGR